jgi:hypothetical protein
LPLALATATTLAEFERTLDKIAEARPFAKAVHQPRAFSLAAKLLQSDEGLEALFRLAPRFDSAGLFDGGDWATPQTLEPALVRATLQGEGMYPALESLNQLRFLSIANGGSSHPDLSPEDALGYLEEVLACNLDLPFPEATELTRGSELQGERLQRLFRFLLEHLGTQRVVGALARECERILLQRPIMVQRVTTMLRSVERLLSAEATPGEGAEYEQARWMIEAMTGPSELAQQFPGADEYWSALAGLDASGLAAEVERYGRRMDESGLVSPAHATLLRFVAQTHPALMAEGLALNRIGQTSLAEHGALVAAMIERAVLPETAQCIYGLSRLLNRGILFFPPVPPALEGLLVTRIDPAVGELLRSASQLDAPPDPGALLLAGTLSVIGQPRGVDQGHNPTCQAARAISLWSQNDVGYLLELITRAATENDVLMHFEGATIRAGELSFGLAAELHTELDPVSLVLTPHLDKIYMEMSRQTIGRDGDGHRWVNPEFHGWWVYTGFASLVDTHTGGIQGFEGFVRTFYATYHPVFNGGRNLVYAQPCGVVSTGPNAEFVGWHAVSIQRVALDPSGEWRVYFFNPNRDKGQNWGNDIVTETCDNGELEGESSLPFEQFLMRLYLFHFDPRDVGEMADVPADAVERVRAEIATSWARDRAWLD